MGSNTTITISKAFHTELKDIRSRFWLNHKLSISYEDAIHIQAYQGRKASIQHLKDKPYIIQKLKEGEKEKNAD